MNHYFRLFCRELRAIPLSLGEARSRAAQAAAAYDAKLAKSESPRLVQLCRRNKFNMLYGFIYQHDLIYQSTGETPITTKETTSNRLAVAKVFRACTSITANDPEQMIVLIVADRRNGVLRGHWMAAVRPE
jgi:hypothetical protein